MRKTLSIVVALTLLSTAGISSAFDPGDEARFQKLIDKFAIDFPSGNEKLKPKAVCVCDTGEPGIVMRAVGEISCKRPTFDNGNFFGAQNCNGGWEILAK